MLTEPERLVVESYLDAKYFGTVTNIGFSDIDFSYQWQFEGSNIAGATSKLLTITNAQPPQAGNYGVIVSNEFGSVTSTLAQVTIILPITITSHPQSQPTLAGGSATFSVSVTGDSPSYQWRFGGSPINGATTSSLTISNVQSSNIGFYSVLVTNTFSTVVSSNALLNIVTIPRIYSWPMSRAAATGSNTVFAVSVDGTGPFRYQWQFNSVDLSGATGARLTITNVQPIDGGDYRAIVTNLYGAATSKVATLTVMAPVTILSQPQNAHVDPGATATFAVSVSGDFVHYQWTFDGSDIPGATNGIFSVTNAQPSNAGSYTVRVTNAVSSVQSSAVPLAIEPLPIIASQPEGYTGLAGSTVTLSVVGDRKPPFVSSGTLQLWLKADTGVVTDTNGYVTQWQDQSDFSNDCFQTNISNCPLFVDDALNGKPFIHFDVQTNGIASYLQGVNDVGLTDCFTSFLIYQHQDQNWDECVPVLVGDVFAYSHARAHYIYQNRMAFSAWGNSYLTSLIIPTNVYRLWSMALDSGQSVVEVWDTDGTSHFYSSMLTGGLQSPASGYYIGGLGWTDNFKGDIAEVMIYKGRLNDTDRAGVENYLETKYFGNTSPGVAYQWNFNGTPLPGATGQSLTLTNAQPEQSGNYTVVLSNLAGVVTSNPAVVKIRDLFAVVDGQMLTNSTYDFTNAVTVSFVTSLSASNIFYTLDQSTPTNSSPPYTAPFLLEQSAVVRGVAYSQDFSVSGESDPITINIVNGQAPPIPSLRKRSVKP